MFVNNINPVILNLGPLSIRYYGIAWAFGLLFTWYYMDKNKKILRISSERVVDVLLIDILSLLFFSKIVSVYVYRPQNFIALLHGKFDFTLFNEFSALGGYLGLILGNYISSKRFKIDFWRLNDITLIPIMLAISSGRIANYTNHELYGRVTNVPWCVVFFPGGACRHPVQIYEAIAYFIIFLILLFIKKKTYDKRKFFAKGSVFVVASLCYLIVRFFLEYLKQDKIIIWGLGTTQLLFIIYFIFYVILFWKRNLIVFRTMFKKIFKLKQSH